MQWHMSADRGSSGAPRRATSDFTGKTYCALGSNVWRSIIGRDGEGIQTWRPGILNMKESGKMESVALTFPLSLSLPETSYKTPMREVPSLHQEERRYSYH